MAEQLSPPAGLAVGRIVHYVLPSGYGYPGEHRPAIVVKVWGSPPTEPYPIQIVVFLDGSNDAPGQGGTAPLTKWATSVVFDETGQQPGSWHFPERA